MHIGPFTKDETQILKGVGILLIVLHNFYHNLTPLIGENEFGFRFQYVLNFWNTIVTEPLEMPRAFLSYFGHYGVQIFVFFSAYGLTKKYYQRPLKYAAFMRDRAAKIYFPFLLCVAIYIVLGLLKGAFLTDEKVLYWDSLLWKILLISNFIPDQALMPVGPWWFLPFIFQFYLLYPLLLWLFEKYGSVVLGAISAIAICSGWFFNHHFVAAGTNIYYMVFGHLPVLCVGMYMASRDGVSIKGGYLWLLLLLFLIGNINRYAWELSGLCFTVLVLAVAANVFRRWGMRRYLTKALVFYGGISFPLFMVNGFLRSPFHQFAETHNLWWVDNIAALASLFFSTAFAIAFNMIDVRLSAYAASVNKRLTGA